VARIDRTASGADAAIWVASSRAVSRSRPGSALTADPAAGQQHVGCGLPPGQLRQGDAQAETLVEAEPREVRHESR
jgi:hypothetical protein